MATPVDLNLVGAIEDIPAASSAYNGKTYFATDEDGGTFYRCNGTTWVKVAAAVNEAGGTPVTTSLYSQVILYDNVLASAGTWDVSSIAQTYDHLRIIAKLRGEVAAAGVGFLLAFNADTTAANYKRTRITGSATIASAQDDTYQIMAGPAGSADAGYFAFMDADIPLYAGNAYKVIFNRGIDYRGGGASIRSVITGHIAWLSNAAINRITITADNATNTLAVGSRLQIIGIKGVDVMTGFS